MLTFLCRQNEQALAARRFATLETPSLGDSILSKAMNYCRRFIFIRGIKKKRGFGFVTESGSGGLIFFRGIFLPMGHSEKDRKKGDIWSTASWTGMFCLVCDTPSAGLSRPKSMPMMRLGALSAGMTSKGICRFAATAPLNRPRNIDAGEGRVLSLGMAGIYIPEMPHFSRWNRQKLRWPNSCCQRLAKRSGLKDLNRRYLAKSSHLSYIQWSLTKGLRTASHLAISITASRRYCWSCGGQHNGEGNDSMKISS